MQHGHRSKHRQVQFEYFAYLSQLVNKTCVKGVRVCLWAVYGKQGILLNISIFFDTEDQVQNVLLKK